MLDAVPILCQLDSRQSSRGRMHPGSVAVMPVKRLVAWRWSNSKYTGRYRGSGVIPGAVRSGACAMARPPLDGSDQLS
jgi:hypothetical protein